MLTMLKYTNLFSLEHKRVQHYLIIDYQVQTVFDNRKLPLNDATA